MVDWEQMREEYMTGGTSYRRLAAKHGVSYGTLARTARKEGWTALQRENEERAHAQTVADGAENMNGIQGIDEIADKLLARLSALAEEELDTQGVKQIASVLKDIRDIKNTPLEFSLQRAKIRKLERETELEEDSPREIEVVFKAGTEAWNE